MSPSRQIRSPGTAASNACRMAAALFASLVQLARACGWPVVGVPGGVEADGGRGVPDGDPVQAIWESTTKPTMRLSPTPSTAQRRAPVLRAVLAPWGAGRRDLDPGNLM